MAAAWLPEGHAAYWDRYGAQAMEVATLYDGARFFWAVPRYVPADAVASIADLAKPAVADRMTRLIQSVGAGATITTVSGKAAAEYVAAVGLLVRPGHASRVDRCLQRGHRGPALDRVPDVGAAVPQSSRRPPAAGRSARCARRVNRAALVAPNARPSKSLPERTRQVLSRISLGLDGVTDMDWAVNVEKQTPRDAARAWLRANAARVAAWGVG